MEIPAVLFLLYLTSTIISIIHYAMPIRVMGYDYGTYKKQYDSNGKNYQTAKGLDEDEYLSRMKKTNRFTPVITVVVYYGDKPCSQYNTCHMLKAFSMELLACSLPDIQ